MKKYTPFLAAVVLLVSVAWPAWDSLEKFATSLVGYKETTKPDAVSGQVQVYAKDKAGTSALYMQQDNGTETELGVTPTTGTSLTLSGDVTAVSFHGAGSELTGLTKTQVGLANVENTALSTWAGSTSLSTGGAMGVTSVTASGDITAVAFHGTGTVPTTTGASEGDVLTVATGVAAWATASGGGDITDTAWDGSNWTATDTAPSQSALQTIFQNFGTWSNTYLETFAADDNLSGYSLRQVVSCTVTGTRVQVVIDASTVGAMAATHVSIVEQDSGANGIEVPTELKFSAASGFSIGAGEVITSDKTAFVMTSGKSYLVCVDFTASGYTRFKASGTCYYKASSADWDQATVSGYSTQSQTYGLSKIRVFTPVPYEP